MKISLVILKELIEEGLVFNRHIKTLFEENAISSFEDLQVQELAFASDYAQEEAKSA